MRSRTVRHVRSIHPRSAAFVRSSAIGATLVVITVSIATLGAQSATAIATTIDLRTAEDYSVLASQAVTNTGDSVLGLGLAVSPLDAVSGFPPGRVGGEVHRADAEALQAQTDLTAAYLEATSQVADTTIAVDDIGDSVFTPGVHSREGALGLTGTVTLDAEGDPDAVFLFKIASGFTTATSSTVATINGADPCRVFWQVGSSATLGGSTTFEGTLMALTSISTENGTTVDGRLLARNGAVTLINTVFTDASCAAATTPPTSNPPGTTIPTTNPPGTTPPTSNPPGTTPPTSNPPGTTPPTSNPPGTTPPTSNPPGTTPPTSNPPVGEGPGGEGPGGPGGPGVEAPGPGSPGVLPPEAGPPTIAAPIDGRSPRPTDSTPGITGSGAGGSGGSSSGLAATGTGPVPLALGAGVLAALALGLTLVLRNSRRRV